MQADAKDITRSRFETLWRRSVGSRDAASAWHALDAGYSEPLRAYHNWSHIGAMLAGLDGARGVPEFQAVSFDEVELAVFFHDVIYDPRAKDNETRSAAAFRSASADASILNTAAIDRIAAAILATATHAATPDISTRLLLDLDLRVLGGTPDDYLAYVDAVRHEYAFVPDDQWRVGRTDVLRRFLERPAIFQTAHVAERYEAFARENIRSEIEALTRPG